MSFSLSVRKNRTVNLILNDHSIRYLDLKQTNPPVAQKWGERFLPPGIISEGRIIDFESLENILEECLEDWKLNKRSVRFTVPDPLVIIRKVAVPADVEEDELKSYLYLELGSSIHLPFEDPVFDIYQLPSEGSQKEILLFASPEKYVMELADLLSGLKLNPVSADISPLALYRLYHTLDQGNRDERLFNIQFTLTSVTMSVFENQIPQFMRHFPLDFDLEKWEIKRDRTGHHEYRYTGESTELQFQLDDIYKEMIKLMDFYKYSLHNGSKEISKILLSGDHPLLLLIYKEINERFEVPVQTLNIETVTNTKNKVVPATHLLALGLALKEVE
ncbi:pilus assembly protein PilM [Neobacillus sp. PS3-34]|uniref:type IV pilus biogenesis protein PilM n=1 Tax=Neobacillus sp. PS3-34 TaxID=3070678 RepID=UPI0027E013E2|nr:pilus assembly protein PilM [Neobacillus sp. PS3-34]WML47376.1 pilus assembly protein PilM [Neobacillus sp. PS3-34]